jgi:hypothetical protein
VDHNVHNGLKKYIGDNPDDPEGILVRYEQDAEPILDANKAAQNEDWDRRSDMWHAAHVPVGVMYEWLVKFGVDCWRYSSCEETRRKVNRLLDSNEYRYLRVRNFNIGWR